MPIFGSLAKDDLRRAFVAGAQWWEWNKTGATMWPSDQREAEEIANERYPGGKVREDQEHILEPEVSVRFKWANSWNKEGVIFGAWCIYRESKGVHVSTDEATFVWREWAKGAFDLIIPEKDYKEIFPGL